MGATLRRCSPTCCCGRTTPWAWSSSTGRFRQHLPPKARPTQFRRVLELLEDVQPGGETNVGGILHEVAERIRQRGLVIIISDLIDDEASIANGLQHFCHKHHNVLVFHVLDPAELAFPYEQLTRFKDIEGQDFVVANPKSLRSEYLGRMKTSSSEFATSAFPAESATI